MTNRPVSLRNFIVAEGFWKDRMELVRTEVIPYQWDILNDRVTDANPSYCMRNFRIAGKLLKEQREMGASFQQPVYTFRGFETLPDEAIETVCAAQHENGYLDTYCTKSLARRLAPGTMNYAQ